MATHSNILDWEIPWTEEPSGHSPWVSKSQTWLSIHTEKKPSILSFIFHTSINTLLTTDLIMKTTSTKILEGHTETSFEAFGKEKIS